MNQNTEGGFVIYFIQKLQVKHQLPLIIVTTQALPVNRLNQVHLPRFVHGQRGVALKPLALPRTARACYV